MKARLPKRIITLEESAPKALIIGQKSRLIMLLVETLEKKGCLVFISEGKNDQREFIHDQAFPDLFKVDYIFQFKPPQLTKSLLKKAAQDKARYLLVMKKKDLKDFESAEEKIRAFDEKIDGRFLWLKDDPAEALSSQVDQVLKAMFGRKKPLPPALKFKKTKNAKKRRLGLPKLTLPNFKTAGFFLSLLILLIFFLPYLFFGFCLLKGGQNLRSFEKKFWGGDLSYAQQKADLAQNYFLKAKETAILLPLLNAGERLANFGQTLSQTALSGVRLVTISQKISRLILEEEKGNLPERLEQLKVEAESLERQLSLTSALSEDLKVKKLESVVAFSLGEKIKRVAETLSSLKELCSLIKKSLPLADEVLGLREERVYLILFQNNMELRPGGGFIGSFGLAHFKNGVFETLETHDVYTADGQLKGHVDPPAPIRKYLNQPHFFLRDSNFSPDFAVNAEQAVWFLKKEMKQEVDGVIGIDLTFVQKLLEGLGEVYLPDYQQKITAENLFLKAETLIQTDFFPGSTSKRDFLGSLSRGIFNQARVGNFPWFKVGQSLKQGLEEKHLQIFLFNKLAQKQVEELGWGGRVVNIKYLASRDSFGMQKANIKNYLPDYLMIVEANLGVNKANYFIKREVDLETEFNQDRVLSTLSLSYRNESPGGTFPGGAYKNFLRAFVPKSAVLEKVLIENQSISLNQVETEGAEDKKSWGILVEIPALTRKKIVFVYYQGLPASFSPGWFTYELFFQKQAGTDKDPLFLKFNYPKDWQIKKTNFVFNGENGVLTLASDLAVDRVFLIDF